MSEHTSHSNQDPTAVNSARFSKQFRRRVAATVFGAGAAVGIATGAVATHAIDARAAHDKLPGCDISADPYRNNSISAAQNTLDKSGQDVSNDAVQVVTDEGHVRNRHDDAVSFRDGSIIVQPTDHFHFEHVEPQVCVTAGGEVDIPKLPAASTVDQQLAQNGE